MNDRPILLDTCAALLIERAELKAAAEEEIERSSRAGAAVMISPITAWELGMLVSKGRLSLSMPPDQWFNALLESGVTLAAMPPEMLIASSFLPGSPLRDPADRIIVATARMYGFRLATRDRPMLDLAAEGHLLVIPC